MRNIILYEFLNFRPTGTGAIAFETTKLAYIAGATGNKQLDQKAQFSFLYTDSPLYTLPSKHKNRATLRAVQKSVAPV